MKLVFIRHAQAEGHFLQKAEEDWLRELTLRGKRQFVQNLKALRPVLPKPDVIFCSPLVRSIQTAELVWESWKSAQLELITDLDLLDDPRHLVEHISLLPHEGTYFFVGHEPHLSSVVAGLLGLHPEHDFLRFKKGGFLVIEGEVWSGFVMTMFVAPKLIEVLA